MRPNSDDHADPAGRQEALRRRVLGLVLGGVLSAAIGWGLNGGWQYFHLLGVPIHSGPGAFPLTAVWVYGLIGIVWGLVVAWPQKWQLARLVQGTKITILIVLLLGLLLVVAGTMLRNQFMLQIFLVVAGLVIIGLAAVLPSVLLRFITARLASWQTAWKRRVAALAALLLLVALGLGPTYLIDSFNRGFVANVGCDPSGVHVLRAVHQYALAQGWQGYSLEAVRAESCHTAARVYMPGGQTRSCKASMLISYLPIRNKQPEITVTCSP